MELSSLEHADAYANAIAQALSSVDVGPAVDTQHLTVIPLRTRQPLPRDFLLLDEARFNGGCRVTEASAWGRVAEVTVINDCDRPVLILDGEQLVGAKQNRIVNLTILVPPHTSLNIPVSCVEAQRWSYVSDELAPSGYLHYGDGRKMNIQQITKALHLGQPRCTDQHAVWNDLRDKSRRMGAASPTGASMAIYARWRDQLDELKSAIRPDADDVGAIFVCRGRIAGLELVGASDCWCRILPQVLTSYGLDALDVEQFDRERRPDDDPTTFLRRIRDAATQCYVALGLGVDIRLQSSRLCGAALWWDDRIVHLLAFPTEDDDQRAPRRWRQSRLGWRQP